MSDSDSYSKRASAQQHPDAERVGTHLVIDKEEWIPGQHPEPHLREEGQTGYWESLYRCVQCDVEVLNKSDLPEECDGQWS